jgi:threonyl-tRNA synthetase
MPISSVHLISSSRRSSAVSTWSIWSSSAFGFEYKAELSVRHATDREKYLGSDEIWDLAERALAEALNERGLPYQRMEDEAAFYGPKIDFKVVDAIKRTWQLSTIQVDFNLPQRFGIEFVGNDNKPHQSDYGASGDSRLI